MFRNAVIGLTEAAARLTAYWPALFRTTRRIAHRFAGRQNEIVTEVEHRLIDRLAPDLTVRQGLCAGLRYPARTSAGSVLVPKLLGTYEQELYPALERWIAAGPEMIVDVGCAEGFYAVGLALRLPGVPVHAFDPDPHASAALLRLAACNSVEDRVRHAGFCDSTILSALAGGRRALIISDCEGYEDTLFAETDPAVLARSYVLIESHDFIHPGVTGRLQARLEQTHHVSIIVSGSHQTAPALPAGLTAMERYIATSEWRPPGMKWVLAEPR